MMGDNSELKLILRQMQWAKVKGDLDVLLQTWGGTNDPIDDPELFSQATCLIEQFKDDMDNNVIG